MCSFFFVFEVLLNDILAIVLNYNTTVTNHLGGGGSTLPIQIIVTSPCPEVLVINFNWVDLLGARAQW